MREEQVATAKEAERALLGAILVGGNGAFEKALAIVQPTHFFSRAHRTVYEVLLELRAAGQPTDDIVLLREKLDRNGGVGAVGGAAFLASLVDGVPHSDNAEHYARAVREAAERRDRQEALLEEAAALGPALAREPTTDPAAEPTPSRGPAPVGVLHDQKLSLTDDVMASQFVWQYGTDLRCVRADKPWLVWHGTHWKEDKTAAVLRMGRNLVRSLYAKASEIAEDKTRQQFVSELRGREARRRLDDMIALARSDRPVQREDLDRDPWLLGVANGTVDLRTGVLRAARRGDLITKQTGCAYDPDAHCPQWEAFLSRIMGGNQDLVAFLQRAVGHSLTGDTSEDVLFVLHGPGANGKSTFLRALLDLFGSYGQQAAGELLVAKRRDTGAATPDLADLRGARLVSVIETDEGQRLAEGLAKRLSGGDLVKARHLFQDLFEFEPTWKLFLACNHLPKVRGTDLAIWRRIRLVPFTVVIPKQEQLSREVLRARFRAEQPGILAWAISGCLAWQADGLQPPREVLLATEEYRAGEDTLAGFLDEVCELGPNLRVPKGVLYAQYTDWCKRTGEYQSRENDFRKRLRERGFDEDRDKTGRWWLGIGLRQVGTGGDGNS